MPGHEEFFATKKAAAVFKHGILKRYPVVFAAKTGGRVEGKRVVFLDGYAGRGEYDDGEPGSPLPLSRCAEYVQTYRDVLGFYVEQDSENFANLQRVLEEKGGRAKRVIKLGSLDEHLPELLARAHGASLFAFLDPFGPALDFDLIKARLLGRPRWPPTEVLLHFSALSVARVGRAVHVARTTHGGLSESNRKTADRLSRFLGGDWWQEHFAEVRDERDEERATDVALHVSKQYQRMLTAGTNYRAVGMPVRPRPDLAPKYVLVLFTASSEGAWFFADSLGQAGRDWMGAWLTERAGLEGPQGQASLFGETLTTAFDPHEYEISSRGRWVATIADNIDRMLDNVGSFVLADRVPDVYGSVLGQAWARHAREAVIRLHALRAVNHDGKGEFYRARLARP